MEHGVNVTSMVLFCSNQLLLKVHLNNHSFEIQEIYLCGV